MTKGKVDLHISTEKSNIIHIGTQIGAAKIKIGGQTLNEAQKCPAGLWLVKRFTYFCTIIEWYRDADSICAPLTFSK